MNKIKKPPKTWQQNLRAIFEKQQLNRENKVMLELKRKQEYNKTISDLKKLLSKNLHYAK